MAEHCAGCQTNWEQEAEQTLRTLRQTYQKTSVTNPVLARAPARSQAAFTVALPNLHYGGQRVNRSIWSATYTFICSLLDEKNTAQLADKWINAGSRAEKLGAIGAYVRCAGEAAGVSWISVSLMEALDQHLEDVLMKSSVVSNMTNRQLCVVSGAKSAGAGAVVKFVFDVVIYTYQHANGIANPEDSPWKLHKLLETGLVAGAAGLINYAALGTSGVIATMIVPFACVMLVSELIGKFTDRVKVFGLRLALSNWWRGSALVWDYDDAQANPPPDLCCPISHTLFVKPVILFDQVFEKKEIEHWIATQGVHPYDPTVRVSLRSLKPCYEMEALVYRFAKAHNILLMRQIQY